MTSPQKEPVDKAIDTKKQLEYWNGVEATHDGMLGGFEIVHRVDIQGSKNFFAKLRLPRDNPPFRVADCGAGIGRITKNFLTKINKSVTVDIIEPVQKFTTTITSNPDFEEERREGRIGRVFNVGLEDWAPEEKAYWLIWTQWCVGHLTDAQLVEYVQRCGKALRDDGVLVVKENLASGAEDIFDEVDSSVTRSDQKFRKLFKDAGMKIVATEVQKGMPKGLYQVRSYALKVYQA
ncbi:hypothetical protein EX30DRAFT_339996 [Ascodesmis nigricans]|uniref:Alpha N-terminal protein methyltransferase 1 n=1 Tax=Ascodesmis nigricans TaxID=341454 RepID=A0A4S2MZ72_9PEZI|nr:hypothetical protein EX30DRAFT_339996 [Ascodesmis nigricans]